MAIFMLGAAVSAYIEDINSRIGITACFLFRKAHHGLARMTSSSDLSSFLGRILSWPGTNSVHIGIRELSIER